MFAEQRGDISPRLSFIEHRGRWSQGELAARAGSAKNTVHLFEAGQRSPTENVLAALRQLSRPRVFLWPSMRRQGRRNAASGRSRSAIGNSEIAICGGLVIVATARI